MVDLLLVLLVLGAVGAVPDLRTVPPGRRVVAGGRAPSPHPSGGHGGSRTGLPRALVRVARRLSRPQVSAGPLLADLVELLAAPLRAGSSTVSAVSAVVAAEPGNGHHASLLGELRQAGLEGEPMSTAFLRFAHETVSPEAAFVGRAWWLSEQTGAPLAEALQCAAQVLRAHTQTQQRLAAASAGPRASMAVLCLLPLAGPAVGLVFEVSPADLYLGSPLATGSLALGVLLAGVGLVWSRALLRRATRPRRMAA